MKLAKASRRTGSGGCLATGNVVFKPRTPTGRESYTLSPMDMTKRKLVTLLTATMALGGAAGARAASLPEIESAYADFNDAAGAIGLIESGLRDSYEGRTGSEWQRLQED